MKSAIFSITFMMLSIILNSQTLFAKFDTKELQPLGVSCDSLIIENNGTLIPFKCSLLNNETDKFEYVNYLNFNLLDSASYSKKYRNTNYKVLYKKIKYKYIASNNGLNGVIVEFTDLKYELFNKEVTTIVQITIYENGTFEYHFKNIENLNEYLANVLTYTSNKDLLNNMFVSHISTSNNKFVSGLTINPYKLFPYNKVNSNNHFIFNYENGFVCKDR